MPSVYRQIASLIADVIGSSVTVSRTSKGAIRFRMKLNVSRDTLKVFLNLASEKVLQTFSHQPVFLFSRRQERTGRGTVMFLWEISNDRRQVKLKNRFLLATRLLNANCIWSGLLLPSLIAHARKTSSSFPQFAFPAIFFSPFLSNNRWPQKCHVHFCN